MRQVSIIAILISLIFTANILPSFSAIKGGINYSIPIDYSKLSEEELKEKARVYYFNALQLKDGTINEDMTNALLLYSVLQKINPDSIEYPIKLGVLQDKIGKDRQAKGNFSKAIGIDNDNPLTYFCMGEFYYRRELYRKALREFNKAYSLGFNKNYKLLYRMGDIYEKFGDTRSALKYLKEAELQSFNPELENKIKRIEAQDAINNEFYSSTRIRK